MPYEPLVENALWALKNIAFHAPQSLKDEVMAALGWDTLRTFLRPPTPPSLRAQALSILQNLLDDQSQTQLTRTVDTLGPDVLFGMLHDVLRGSDSTSSSGSGSGFGTGSTAWPALPSSISSGHAAVASSTSASTVDDADLKGAAMYILGSLALGPERLRRSITDRVPLLEALSDALNSRDEYLRLPALRALRHLVEKGGEHGRSHRPRQGVVDLLQPYQLKSRVREIAENAPSTTVRQRAIDLLEILERAR